VTITRWLFVAVLLACGLLSLALRPVCVPIPNEAMTGFDPPIAARTDRDFYVKVFQQRDGQWQQCKTWISRQLFF
jgi:hypothetical protein